MSNASNLRRVDLYPEPGWSDRNTLSLPGGAESVPRAASFRIMPRLWPRSLAARTALVLLLGLGIVQAAGLTIHAFDRIGLERIAQQRDEGMRLASIYRSVAETDPSEREAETERLHLPEGFKAAIGPGPDLDDLDLAPPNVQHMMHVNMQLMPIPQRLRPPETVVGSEPGGGGRRFAIAMRLPDDTRWLNISLYRAPPNPFRQPTFPLAFVLMTFAAGVLTLWAVRRLTEPVRTLAAAAERLGRDVNAPPLPEDGPLEVATAASAFNTMASRIRRFVSDRTLMLTAIGHDLRTPITRMKLRAEFIEDDELRGKFLSDLDELESMVSATLAFGRESADREPLSTIDLRALLSTIVDDAVDARPDLGPDGANGIGFAGPPVTIKARPLALKRALSNLINNSLTYGGGAQVTLLGSHDGDAGRQVRILIEDRGPGIPAEVMERVFEPFFRVEASRNRETGGTGLGLSIARNILRGHGGDVALANRAEGGLRVTVTLPV